MKLRLFACVALAMVVAGASALSSRMALAQAGRDGQGQQAEQNRGQSGGQSADIDKALQAYEERMGRNLDKCRQEMEQMKKELHELIDLRINMAMSLADLRARNPMPGGGGSSMSAYRQAMQGSQGSQGRGEGGADRSGLARELQQVHNQLRSEIEQQQNQIAQLASQLRAMKEQGQQPNQGRQAQQAPQPGQGNQGQNQPQGQQVQRR
jgi:hypothetical protein